MKESLGDRTVGVVSVLSKNGYWKALFGPMLKAQQPVISTLLRFPNDSSKGNKSRREE